MECQLCYSEFEDDCPNVKYKMNENDEFIDFNYCSLCIETMLDNRYDTFVKNIIESDCQKSFVSSISCPIPNKLTSNLLHTGEEIYEFEIRGERVPSILKKRVSETTFSDSEFNEFNTDITKLRENINENGIDSCDYLSYVDELKIKFKLNLSTVTETNIVK